MLTVARHPARMHPRAPAWLRAAIRKPFFPDVPVSAQNCPLYSHPLSPFKRTDLAGPPTLGRSNPPARLRRHVAGNDPHLGFTAPVDLGTLAAARVSGAGGGHWCYHSRRAAVLTDAPPIWAGGLTSSYMDDQDVYIEELNPANHEAYARRRSFKEIPQTVRPFITCQGHGSRHADPALDGQWAPPARHPL